MLLGMSIVTFSRVEGTGSSTVPNELIFSPMFDLVGRFAVLINKIHKI